MDAFLVCRETRKSLWLGKPIRTMNNDGTERVLYYHWAGAEDPPNHEWPLLNKVLWKFPAYHAHLDMRVVFSGEFNEDEYERIGSDDFELEEYLGDWPVRGASGP
jgi:hypothetical protein